MEGAYTQGTHIRDANWAIHLGVYNRGGVYAERINEILIRHVEKTT